jgi:transposase-like protein
MTRRKFSREFKLEAVKLVTERGVTVAQVCRDLELAESVLRRWMREAMVAPGHCCRTLAVKDSHHESMWLDGRHEQARARPLPRHQLA